MFDWYRPWPEGVSADAGAALQGWQGTDGPCGLMVWEQGQAGPVDQLVDDEAKLSAEALGLFRLPERFEIYTKQGGRWWVAEGRCVDGVWVETALKPEIRSWEDWKKAVRRREKG